MLWDAPVGRQFESTFCDPPQAILGKRVSTCCNQFDAFTMFEDFIKNSRWVAKSESGTKLQPPSFVNISRSPETRQQQQTQPKEGRRERERAEKTRNESRFGDFGFCFDDRVGTRARAVSKSTPKTLCRWKNQIHKKRNRNRMSHRLRSQITIHMCRGTRLVFVWVLLAVAISLTSRLSNFFTTLLNVLIRDVLHARFCLCIATKVCKSLLLFRSPAAQPKPVSLM